MNFFTNKKFLFKLIVCLCICLTIWNFGISPVVEATAYQSDPNWQPDSGTGDNPYAAGQQGTTSTGTTSSSANESLILGIGGKLLKPIVDFCVVLGDAVINIIHKTVMGTESQITVNTALDIATVIFSIIAGIAVSIGFIALTIFTLGANIPATLATIAVGAIGVISTPLSLGTAALVYNGLDGAILPDVTLLPLYSFGPEEIFKGEILLFDVNIFNPKEVYVQNGDDYSSDIMTLEAWNKVDQNGQFINRGSKEAKSYFYYRDGDPTNTDETNIVITSKNNSPHELKKGVSKWYYTMRNFAIIMLMVVLVYIGIRILLSSTASEKAKYKKLIMDWIVGLCLVFVMHYIMVFAMTFVDNITSLFSNVCGNVTHTVTINNANLKLRNKLVNDYGYGEDVVKGENIVWYTNLMGWIRILAQQADGTFASIGYAICFLVLVIYTVAFTFTYLKRLIYIIFLTIIAPLVAVTYPIDKANDGKAQGFDFWFKEYIFNLLIQPLHLLLYTVLMSTAIDISSTNIVYAIVAIGFLMPAEKIVRTMFNFEKAKTPGLLGGAAGAAMVMSGLNALTRIGGGKGKNAPTGQNNDKLKLNETKRGADSGHNFDNLAGEISQDNREKVLPNTSKYRQDMLDLYDEGFGSSESGYNPLEREAMQSEINKNQPDEVNMPSEEDYRQILLESGYEGEELEQAMIDGGYGETEPTQPEEELLDDNDSNEQVENKEVENEGIENGKNIGDNHESSNYKDNQSRSRLKAFGKIALHSIPGTLSKGIKFTGGVAGAVIGLSAGIATGDAGNAAKYTGAGAMAGKTMGKVVGNAVETVPHAIMTGETKSMKSGKALAEQYKREYYGTDYGKQKKKELDEKFAKDKEIRLKYEKELGLDKKYKQEMEKAKKIADMSDRKKEIEKIKEQRKKELDKVMEDAKKYRQYNVTDDKIIIKAMKLDKNKPNNNRASKDKIASAMIASRASNNEDVREYISRLEKQGIKKVEANRIAKNAKLINTDL